MDPLNRWHLRSANWIGNGWLPFLTKDTEVNDHWQNDVYIANTCTKLLMHVKASEFGIGTLSILQLGTKHSFLLPLVSLVKCPTWLLFHKPLKQAACWYEGLWLLFRVLLTHLANVVTVMHSSNTFVYML